MRQGRHTNERFHLIIKETKMFWSIFFVLEAVLGTVDIARNSNVLTMLRSLLAYRGG